MSFETAYSITAQHEGGYANVAGDKGGETYKGIARNYHPTWEGWGIIDNYKRMMGRIPHNHIFSDKALDTHVKNFYFLKFWKANYLDRIVSNPLTHLIYDSAVHHGSGGAGRLLQQSVNEVINSAPQLRVAPIKVDGAIGPKTIDAVNSLPAAKVHDMMKKLRLDYLQLKAQDPTQAKFWQGWYNRVTSFPDLEKKK